jgi:DNA ligase-1
MPDGESVEMQGSAAKPYVLTNTGGVYSCTCPAWRNQSLPIEKRTCKHLRKLRGDEAEKERTGGALPTRSKSKKESTGPPLLLAEKWDNATDLTDWWISEKLDGVRAYWDGKQFLSRQGNIYHAPDWFLEGLPNFPLDGELWMGRKKFQKTVSIVRRQDKTDQWKDIRYLVFDAPKFDGDFETRLEFLTDCLPKRHDKGLFAEAHEHKLCRSVEHLRMELAQIEQLGGEGLMLRQPKSRYHVGRSSTLLKVKTFHDADAVVIGHKGGRGKHKGKMGALVIELKDGTRLKVGTGFSDKQRAAPPEIGSVIAFRYQELTDAGVPRFPSFVRVRDDVMPMKGAPSAKRATKSKSSVAVTVDVSSSPSTAQYFEFVSGDIREILGNLQQRNRCRGSVRSHRQSRPNEGQIVR